MKTNNTLIRLHCGNSKDFGQVRIIHDNDMIDNVPQNLQNWAHLMSNMVNLIENGKLAKTIDLTFFKLGSTLTNGDNSISYYIVFQASELYNNTLGIFEITSNMEPILHIANRYDDIKLFSKSKEFYVDTLEPRQFFYETENIYEISEEKTSIILEKHMLIWQCIVYEAIIFTPTKGEK